MTMTQTLSIVTESVEKCSGQDQRRTQDDEGFEHESIKDDADVEDSRRRATRADVATIE
jgi:hypothetical protein